MGAAQSLLPSSSSPRCPEVLNTPQEEEHERMQNAVQAIGLEFRGLRAGDSIDDAILASGWAVGKCRSFSAFLLLKRVRCDVIAAHPCPESIDAQASYRGSIDAQASGVCLLLQYLLPKTSAPPWVGSRSPDGWDQIPRWAGGWVLHQPPWSFGFDSQTRGNRENRSTLC